MADKLTQLQDCLDDVSFSARSGSEHPRLTIVSS